MSDQAEIDRCDRMMEACCNLDEWVGFIRSGDLESAPHASVMVCGAGIHQNAARIYCELLTGLPARFVPKKAKS